MLKWILIVLTFSHTLAKAGNGNGIEPPDTDSKNDTTCLIVNGFNLCDDAKKIAENTRSDLGIQRSGVEYVLVSVKAQYMRVISHHESIYTESEFLEGLSRKYGVISPSKKQTSDWLTESLRESVSRLCNFYRDDVFVKDGGEFEVHYRFREGRIFLSVLAEKDDCGLLFASNKI